ncbi:hypothetical protein AERO9AM_50591 [Aeromicrobium sp. 9AM]|nr:hypothetical protein AERO9AM_50591 [Aeromicrobium sp. 9AM]
MASNPRQSSRLLVSRIGESDFMSSRWTNYYRVGAALSGLHYAEVVTPLNRAAPSKRAHPS